MSIYSIVPDHNNLLKLEAEEIWGIILEDLNEQNKDSHSRYNYTSIHNLQQYPREHQEQISRNLMEGWIWLEKEWLIAPKPCDIWNGGRSFITRRGKKVKNRSGLKSYQHANLLPKKCLHPRIGSKVIAPFIRWEYETAIFQAFKEIEITVRKEAVLPKELGVPLMRAAFKKNIWPLTDTSTEEGEQEAMQHLFAGAIGTYKNPHSHRNVEIKNPIEAMETIILASHLLRIVDNIKNN